MRRQTDLVPKFPSFKVSTNPDVGLVGTAHGQQPPVKIGARCFYSSETPESLKVLLLSALKLPEP